MLRLDYKRYFGGSKKKKTDFLVTGDKEDRSLRIPESLMNTYALSLYAKHFYNFNEDIFQMFEKYNFKNHP